MKTILTIIMLISICTGTCHAYYVGGVGFIPTTNELTIITDLFCRADNCFGPPGPRPPVNHGPFTEQEWHEAISDAVAQWNSAGANFYLKTRRAYSGEDPCNLPSGTVPIILAQESPYGNVCPGDFQIPVHAGAISFTVPPYPAARMYFSTDHGGGLPHVRRLLIHELGHFLGLYHPEGIGQDVRAVMNADIGCNLQGEPFVWCNSIQLDDIAGMQYAWGGKEDTVFVGYLENPRDDSAHSGIGVISGWACNAEEVEILIWFANGMVHKEKAAYGTSRTDTKDICGDVNNGFGLLFNWNLLPQGKYTVQVLVDGELLGKAAVNTTRFGKEFLQNVEGQYVLEDFPVYGESVIIEWEESLQNFVIVGKE